MYKNYNTSPTVTESQRTIRCRRMGYIICGFKNVINCFLFLLKYFWWVLLTLNQISMSCFYMCGFFHYNNQTLAWVLPFQSIPNIIAGFFVCPKTPITVSIGINCINWEVKDAFVWWSQQSVLTHFKWCGWRSLPHGGAARKVWLLSKFHIYGAKFGDVQSPSRRCKLHTRGSSSQINTFLCVFRVVTQARCL